MLHQLRRHWWLIVVSVFIVATSVGGSWALQVRGNKLDNILYDQCVANETQDAVIVQTYLDDIVFVLSSFPDSPQRDQWIQSRRDGIAALEAPDESNCDTPEGTLP